LLCEFTSGGSGVVPKLVNNLGLRDRVQVSKPTPEAMDDCLEFIIEIWGSDVWTTFVLKIILPKIHDEIDFIRDRVGSEEPTRFIPFHSELECVIQPVRVHTATRANPIAVLSLPLTFCHFYPPCLFLKYLVLLDRLGLEPMVFAVLLEEDNTNVLVQSGRVNRFKPDFFNADRFVEPPQKILRCSKIMIIFN
jgi:hypothetical protein